LSFQGKLTSFRVPESPGIASNASTTSWPGSINGRWAFRIRSTMSILGRWRKPRRRIQGVSGKRSEIAKKLLQGCFSLELRQAELSFHPRFHFAKLRLRYFPGKMLEQQPVRALALHNLQSIQHLAMRCPFPDREDHGFAQPALNAIFLQRSHAAIHFHCPFGRLHGELRGPVFCQVSDQTEQMIALRVRRLLLPHLVEQMRSFPSQARSRTQPLQTILKLPPK